MKRCNLILAAATAVVCQAGFLYASSNCPATVWELIEGVWVETLIPNQIFCDDFDTYGVTGGGPPGGPNAVWLKDTGGDDALLQSIWYPTNGGGTIMKVQDTQGSVLYNIYSGTYAGRYDLGQMTVRDWIETPPEGDPDHVLNFHRSIGELYGTQYTAVSGTTDNPLTLEFDIGSTLGRLFKSPVYMELAFGTHTDPMNTANTDYDMWPKPSTVIDPITGLPTTIYCSCPNPITAGPWPMLCALGNPDGGMPADTGCPPIATLPPPVHNAIAVGIMPMADAQPCHCDPAAAHYPVSGLVFYDGQVWWRLRSDIITSIPEATVSGTLTPWTGTSLPWTDAPATPPPPTDPALPLNFNADATPGNFLLQSPATWVNNSSYLLSAGGNRPPAPASYNRVKMTIKEAIIKIELTSTVYCYWVDPATPTVGNYSRYTLTSILDNVPLKYAGPFDRLRAGVSSGCALASNTDWSACVAPTTREPIWFDIGAGVGANFDRLLLAGGVGVSVEGACCNATDGACTMELQSDCIAHGRWSQPFQTCENTLCCPSIYGDDDHDGSVDMTDFGVLQGCITTGGGTINESCKCFDFDGSNTIDSSDIQNFVDCAMGPAVPGDSSGSCEGRLP